MIGRDGVVLNASPIRRTADAGARMRVPPLPPCGVLAAAGGARGEAASKIACSARSFWAASSRTCKG